MTIAGTGATGISIESEGAIKGVQAINQGELLVKNGGTGMKASGRNAVLINTGNIRVQNGGTALDVRKGAMAVNQGTIELVNATMFDRYLPFSCPLNTFVTDAVRFSPFHHH